MGGSHEVGCLSTLDGRVEGDRHCNGIVLGLCTEIVSGGLYKLVCVCVCVCPVGK